MAWVPAAIGAGGSILGGMMGNKGAKSSAQDAANAQASLTHNTINQLEGYDAQQRGGLRSAIAGLLGGGNPFFQAAGGMKPTYLPPGADTAQFGGGPSAPGTFTMPTSAPGAGAGAPPAGAGPFGGRNPFEPPGLMPLPNPLPSPLHPGAGGGSTTQPVARKLPVLTAAAPTTGAQPLFGGFNPFGGFNAQRLTPDHQMPQFAVGAQ